MTNDIELVFFITSAVYLSNCCPFPLTILYKAKLVCIHFLMAPLEN